MRSCLSRWSKRALTASMNSLCEYYASRKMCKRALSRLGARCGLEVAAAMRSWVDVWGHSLRLEATLNKCGRRLSRVLTSRCFTSWLEEYQPACAVHKVGERCFSQWTNREVSGGWRCWKETWCRKKRQEYVVRSCLSRWSKRALTASMNSLCEYYESRKMCKRALSRLGARCGLEVAAAFWTWNSFVRIGYTTQLRTE